MAIRVLASEDDEATLDLLTDVLRADGYETMSVTDCRVVRDVVGRFRPHLALVGGDAALAEGSHVVRWLRRDSEIGVIFITGPDRDEVCAAFEAGVDDCVVKPVHRRELLLRVRAVLRRTGADVPHEWQVGDLLVDEGARAVYRADQEIRLSRTEFRLLVALVRHRNRVVPRSQLATEVWGYSDRSGNLLDAHMSVLRRKLEAAGPGLIVTLRGEGYMMRP